MHESEAEQLIKQAYEAWDAEDWLSAAGLLERVLAGFPDLPESAVWWYDAALAHKFLRNWAKAYELGREAAARAPRGEGEPAHWNLASPPPSSATGRRPGRRGPASASDSRRGRARSTGGSGRPACAWTRAGSGRWSGSTGCARPGAGS
ncbi:hypothetical protein [Streptomyces puniciscabiei]|uniref:hypothetical protein n=1 Tax=Streptomyces puniciscabiei TaxID=164348 RepID=UPI0037A080B0